MSTEISDTLQEIFYINNVETMKVLVSSFRARILSALIKKAYTVKQLSEILKVPPNRLYYHVNLLEQNHLIRVVETRVISGILENHYRAVAATYLVDPALLAPDSALAGQTLEMLLRNVLDLAREDIIRLAHNGVIDVTGMPPEPQALFARRISLVVPQRQVKQVYQKIDRFLHELSHEFSVELEHNGSRAGYTLVAVFYPHDEG